MTSTPAPTYELAPRTVRPSETPLRVPPKTEGDTEFTLIGLTTGLPSLVGSHAEMPARGQFVRIRLVVVNTGRTTTTFDPGRQLLITSDGAEHRPDEQARLIKRQPERFDLGAGVRVEFDLYYDIAADGRPGALRVHGGPTLTDPADDRSLDIPLS
jgi:hypothetical protein